MSELILKRKYLSNQNPSFGRTTPIKGYYSIIEVVINEGSSKRNDAIAHANWKEKESDCFLKEAIFPIQLSFLYNKNSEGPKIIPVKFLKGLCIHVKNVDLIEYFYEGKPSMAYKIEWEIIENQELYKACDPNKKPILTGIMEELGLLHKENELNILFSIIDQIEEDEKIQISIIEEIEIEIKEGNDQIDLTEYNEGDWDEEYNDQNEL